MEVLTRIKELFGIVGRQGFLPEELAPVKAAFGALPALLEEYYMQVGRNTALNNTQDVLVVPKEIVEYSTESHLVFYSENQSVSLWGIRRADLTLDDPPIFETYDGGESWYQTTDTLSAFLLSMAHLQAVYCMERGLEDFWNLDAGCFAKIRESYIDLGASSKLYTGVWFSILCTTS